MLRVC